MPAAAAATPAEAATAGWGLGEDELTQVMGLGSYLGEVRQGPDGNLYQWVEGYDGLGNPVGFWKSLRRLARGVIRRALPLARQFIPGAQALRLLRWRPIRGLLRRALPFAQRFAPFIPGFGPAVAAGLRVATPILRQAGVTGYDGLGALYQAPDGTLYQVQGLAEDEDLRGLAEDEELRGWGLAEDEELRGLAEDEELRGWGLAEDEELRGLGALYQAPDGTLYQVQGFAEDEELRGFAEDEERRGFAEDEELRGFAEDEELRGFAEDEELRGFAEDEELRGFAEDEELRGLYGYVREDGVGGLDAFVPDQPAGTPWFTPPAQPPEIWKPLW
jgi:hypothetical protein